MLVRCNLPEVPTPAEFSLPYTDLELTTSDGVKLKCYLLLQHPDLHVPGATKIEWDSDGDDEKYDMVNHTSKLDGPCSSSMSDPIVSFLRTVCCNSSDHYHVSRERRKSWSPNPARQDIFREDALQCSHVVVPRVSSLTPPALFPHPFIRSSQMISACFLSMCSSFH